MSVLAAGGEEKEQREATMYGVKIDTPTCCWMLGLQYTCEAKTRCGGLLGSFRCEAKWIRVGQQEKHHMMLQSHIMTNDRG